ncbi:MAG: glycosyltransferase family 2 protein [Butyrivibrio sp.]|nr:glycosyltransferase family 2 protein [Butyrivibrio sp.]
MKKGLVSIITPCYNGEKYISQTIESVLAQTYTEWEMIIIDDGSKDNSAEIIKSYNVPKIQYVYQNNAGSAAARNNGIRRAQGQYIALLDSDDIWLPNFLECQIKYMREKKTICVACSYSYIDCNSKDILKPTKVKPIITVKDMRVKNQIGCLTGLYDCSKYGKILLKEELKSMRDDYAYWYDLVSLEGRAYGNPQILAKYRFIYNSTTGNKKKLIMNQYRFYRNYLKETRLIAILNVLRWGISGFLKFKCI